MRTLRLPLLLALPLVFSACDSTSTDVNNVRRAFIERVVINEFPLTQPNGDGWDGGGPDQADVYFLLLGVNNSDIVINGEEDGVVAFDDVDSPNDGIYGGVGDDDLPLDYTLDATGVPESEITVLDRTLRLQVKDDDSPGSTDDVIVTSEPFTLFDQIPATLPSNRRVSFDVTSPDGTLDARITVRYER